jgi:hypothetical protein
MPKEPRAQVDVKDFAGLLTNVDPDDVPTGAAQKQVNVVCITLGELQVRGGYREVTFDA